MTPHSPREVIAQAERKLAREIDAAERALVALRSHKNNISLLARVPHEVFSEIFGILAKEDPPVVTDSHALGWIVVTHVCHRWRTIALKNSSLWRLVDHNIGGQWMKIRLARSQPMSVHLKLRFPHSEHWPNDETLTHALSQLHRIERLGLHDCITQSKFELIRDLLAQDSATLREIHIAPRTVQGLPENEDNLVIATDTFTGNFPNLRSMILKNVQMTWDCTLFAGLTSLRIEGLAIERPTPEHMLAALGRMHDLQNLTLSFALPAATDNEWAAQAVSTQLKNLRYLKINDGLLECTEFLAIVRLPMDSELNITVECDVVHPTSQLNAKIPEVLRHSFGTRIGSSISLYGLAVTCAAPSAKDPMSLALMAFPHPYPTQRSKTRPLHHNVRFVIGRNDPPSVRRKKFERLIVPPVFKGLHVPGLSNLKVDVELLSVHYDYFAWAFRNASNIRSVHVTGRMAVTLWKDFHRQQYLVSTEDCPSMSVRHYPIQNLEVIELEGADFSGFSEGLSKRVADRRVRTGAAPIQKIVFTDCLVRPNFVADCTRALASRKGKVVWDGKGAIHDPEEQGQEDSWSVGEIEEGE